MTVLICDSDITADSELSEILFELRGLESKCFTDYIECITYMKYHSAEMLFLSVGGKEQEHLSVIKEARTKENRVYVCLTGSSPEEAMDVFRYGCDRFLQKPYVASDVQTCLEYFDHLNMGCRSVTVHTFGRFDAFVNGRPVIFHNAKAKELLALCVDRCGDISCAEAVDKLWPSRAFDEKTKRLYRKAVASLNGTLRQYNISNIFKSYRGGCTVNVGAFKCDYYSFTEDPKTNLHSLNGEYMSDYEWAESTLATITRTAEAVSVNEDLSFLYE